MNRQSHSLRSSMLGKALILALLLLFPAKAYTAQAHYDSPDKAMLSLLSAVCAQDIGQLKSVLGPESEQIIFSGDKVADRNLLEKFIKAYGEKHQLVAGKSGTMILIVGKSDWPMPIPIVKKGGKWQFDTNAGKEEILNRRIGRNELSAINTCLAIFEAQQEYISRLGAHGDGVHDYAVRFISEPGKRNGLYWPAPDNAPESPLGLLVAGAAEEGYKPEPSATESSLPYKGYRYRILTRQGAAAHGGATDYMVDGLLVKGFAIIAWPALYGNSGIMTFIMNHEGTIYQRNLGKETAKKVVRITAYNPESSWKKSSPTQLNQK